MCHMSLGATAVILPGNSVINISYGSVAPLEGHGRGNS